MKKISFLKKIMSIRQSDRKRNKKTSLDPKTALVDETNDPGSRTYGPKYIIGATVIRSEQVEKYGEIIEKRFTNSKKEPKFRKSKDRMRKSILCDISGLDPHIYAITIRKPLFIKWTRGEKKKVHINGVEKLTRRIAMKENTHDFHIIFDSNEMIDDLIIKETVEKISKKYGKRITFEIVESKKCRPIQTNDYVIGSLGKKYNRKDDKYINCMNTRVDRKRLIFKRKPYFKDK